MTGVQTCALPISIDEFLAYTQKLQDTASVAYLLEIAKALTDDEKYQNMQVIQEKH